MIGAALKMIETVERATQRLRNVGKTLRRPKQ
jgi:hypothetical protein